MGVARSGVGWLVAKYGALILSFGSLMYFTRVLADPTEVLGLFLVFESVVSLVVVATNSGLASAVTKRISEGTHQAELVGATAAISAVVLVIILVGVLAAAGLITSYFGAGFVIVASLLATLWAHQISDMAKAILRGASLVGRAGGIEFAEILVRVFAQVVLIILGFELVGLIAGTAIGTVAAAAIATAILPYPIAKPAREHISKIITFTKYTYLQGLADRAYATVDTFVIAAILSNSAVSLYNVPFRLSIALDTFSVSISSVVLPEISRQDAMENTDRVREVLSDAVLFSTVLAVPATVGVAILARPLIVTLFTGSFAAGATVAVIAMAIQIPESLRTVFNSVVVGLDRPDVTLRASTLLVVVNLALDVVLVWTVGFEGAAIATLIAVVVATTYLGGKLLSILELGVGFLPIRPFVAQVVAALLMGGIVLLVRQEIALGTLPNLVVLVGLGVVSYWSILLVISPGTRRRLWGIAGDVIPFA